MREVTELDFRMPEFRNAKVEDYEFRDDGKLVRKDRWETAVDTIRSLVGIDARKFEIPDVVTAVRKMAADRIDWMPRHYLSHADELTTGSRVDLYLEDESVLRDVEVIRNADGVLSFRWRDLDIHEKEIITWKDKEDAR